MAFLVPYSNRHFGSDGCIPTLHPLTLNPSPGGRGTLKVLPFSRSGRRGWGMRVKLTKVGCTRQRYWAWYSSSSVLQQVLLPGPSLVDVAEFMALRTSTDWSGFRLPASAVAVGPSYLAGSSGRQTSQSLLPQWDLSLQTQIDLAAECPLDEVGTPIGRALEKKTLKLPHHQPGFSFDNGAEKRRLPDRGLNYKPAASPKVGIPITHGFTS